jgi:8-oxo-dGTP pyrophosphatase MutT (NUDIX family)
VDGRDKAPASPAMTSPSTMTDISVMPIERLELAFTPCRWAFADEQRGGIDTYFEKLRREKPALWNGRVLLLRDFAIADKVFCGRYFETDFASFLAWRDWDFPDPAVKNSFAMGALRGSDGGFVLGLMGAHTANSGKVYFPAGTPEPEDVVGHTVDLAGSLMREVFEETGLTAEDFVPEQGWITVLAGPRIAQMKLLQAAVPAAELRVRILDHSARERQPEWAGVHLAHGPADLDPRMPPFMGAFLTYIWGKE